MKVFVVIALLGVVAAGRRDFCERNPQAQEDAEAARLFINTYLPEIIGHCPTAKSAIAAGTFFSGHCNRVFDEGYCYASSLYSEYNVDELLSECTYGEGEQYSVTVTFEDMANVLAPSSDALKLGNLACRHALPCFKHVVNQLAECSANDDTFYETALENARSLLEPLIDTYSGSVEEFLVCHFGEESDVIALLRLLQKRITSFEDIVEIVNMYISPETQESIVSDAKAGLQDFIQGSQDFCRAGCVKKSAWFFRKVFTATHDEDTCPTIEVYCGGCQDNTDQYLRDNAGSVPCCTQAALDGIVASIQSLIIDYGDLILDIEAAAREAVAEAGIATEEYEAAMESAWEQVDCLGDSYEVMAEGGCASRA